MLLDPSSTALAIGDGLTVGNRMSTTRTVTALGDGLMVIRQLFAGAFKGALINKAISPQSTYLAEGTEFAAQAVSNHIRWASTSPFGCGSRGSNHRSWRWPDGDPSPFRGSFPGRGLDQQGDQPGIQSASRSSSKRFEQHANRRHCGASGTDDTNLKE